MTSTALLLLTGFLLGSIPVGYILGRMQGIDLRTIGSGNIGATNAGRVLGKKTGVQTLIADILKGSVATALPTFIGYSTLAPYVGASAIIGHCFSPFLKFKGGKGVATSLGVFLVLAPSITLICLLIFAVIVKTCKLVSLGSIIATAAFPLLIALDVFDSYSGGTLIAGVITASLVSVRHQSNISRLLKGEEPRYDDPAKKSAT